MTPACHSPRPEGLAELECIPIAVRDYFN